MVTTSKPGGSGEDPVPTGQQDPGGEERTQFTVAQPGQLVPGECYFLFQDEVGPCAVTHHVGLTVAAVRACTGQWVWRGWSAPPHPLTQQLSAPVTLVTLPWVVFPALPLAWGRGGRTKAPPMSTAPSVLPGAAPPPMDAGWSSPQVPRTWLSCTGKTTWVKCVGHGRAGPEHPEAHPQMQASPGDPQPRTQTHSPTTCQPRDTPEFSSCPQGLRPSAGVPGGGCDKAASKVAGLPFYPFLSEKNQQPCDFKQ